MPRLLQFFALLVLTLVVRPAMAFSLLGPTSADPGGEAWQVERIGHNIDGDEGSVKNLGEEYRWNQSIITYAFDPAFVNYFGSNGVAAIEAAIAVYNSLPDVSTLSQTLNEYPLNAPNGAITTFRDSRRINYTARALNLRDLKSFAMGALAEQLGLASPERHTWTLRARETTQTTTNFNVIMRNFDPVTYAPTRYVNGSRYTYIADDITDAISDAVEFPADPESTLYSYSSVANLIGGDTVSLSAGAFFTYLTRDDIGGLRYIYDQDNLNWEQFAPGTQITAPDFSSITLLTNQDLFSFSAFTYENPPAAVLAAFPGLVIQSNISFITTEVQVVGISLTNLRDPWGDPFTTNLFVVPILQTNPVVRYRYEFANVITNYSSPTTDIFLTDVGFEREPWSDPFFPVYRTNIEVVTVDFPSGGFIIVPTNVGQYNFTGFAFTNVTGVTNIIFSTNITENGVTRPVQIFEFVSFTNVIFGVFPFSVQPAPESVLRGGIGKITFQRLTNAIFTGTNFVHTNTYVATYITNGTVITNVFSRANTLPDILFGAADLGTAGQTASPFILSRGVGWTSNADRNSTIAGQGGPGNVFGPITITFNKAGPSFLNTIPGSTTEESAFPWLTWGSFDGSTNAPTVYPQDVTLEDIQILIHGGLVP